MKKTKTIFPPLVFMMFILVMCFSAAAQPTIAWMHSYGGSGYDDQSDIQSTIDGGYIMAGTSTSNDGDVTANHGAQDCWIVKLNTQGNIDWQKSYGGTLGDNVTSIRQTMEGGYIFAGYSNSYDGDVLGHIGGQDYWIVKLSASGAIEWQKTLGGAGSDRAFAIQQTFDGGYIVAGISNSTNGNVTGNHGGNDYWLVRLDQAGNMKWQKSYGGSQTDEAYSVEQTIDGGFIIGGYSLSNNGDITSPHGGYDVWIIKTDTAGTITWQKSYGGLNTDNSQSAGQTSDNGYIIGAYTMSSDNDVTLNYGSYDFWIAKLNTSGTISWQKTFGGTSYDIVKSLKQTDDGGYIIAGYTGSNNHDVTINYGSNDYWVVKLDDAGNKAWQKSYGGTGNDAANTILQAEDDGFIVGGSSYSNDIDVSGNHGYSDFWIVKLSPVVGLNTIAGMNDYISVFPNPCNTEATITYTLKENSYVKLNICDITGKEIVSLANEFQMTGTHNLDFNASKLANGLYFFNFKTNHSVVTGKFTVSR